MRYYKRIKDDSYKSLDIDKIYPEDYKISSLGKSVADSTNSHPHNWEEASEIDYIKQQGWYIKGSDKFEEWLKSNGEKVNNKGKLHGDTNFMYYFIKYGELRTSIHNPSEDKIEVTVDQLNEIYNIESKQMEFKVGDEVLITSWHYYDIKLPQEGVIKKINKGSNTPYYIELEEPPFKMGKSWYFKEGEFEHLNKDKKQMKNFEVKVNPTTSKILQQLAFENGWSWRSDAIRYNKREPKHFDHSPLVFESENKDLSLGTLYYPVISLEEAIDKITAKEESIKEGDWFAVDNFGNNSKKTWVGRYPKQYCYFSGTAWTYSDSFIKGSARKATKEEIEDSLIKEAKKRGYEKDVLIKSFASGSIYCLNSGADFRLSNEYYNGGDENALRFQGACIYSNGKWAEIVTPSKEIFGFDVEKSLDGIYQFGCSRHRYTKEELQRINRTLENIAPETTIGELRSEIKTLIRS